MGSRLLQLELLLPHEFAFSAPFCQTALTPSKSRKQFRELEIPWHSVKVVRIWFLSLPINWCCEKARCQFKYQPIEVLPGANKEGSSPVLPAVAAAISPRHTWVSASAYFWPCALSPSSLGCVLPSVRVDYYELQSQWVEARDLQCIDELSFMFQMSARLYIEISYTSLKCELSLILNLQYLVPKAAGFNFETLVDNHK